MAGGILDTAKHGRYLLNVGKSVDCEGYHGLFLMPLLLYWLCCKEMVNCLFLAGVTKSVTKEKSRLRGSCNCLI